MQDYMTLRTSRPRGRGNSSVQPWSEHLEAAGPLKTRRRTHFGSHATRPELRNPDRTPVAHRPR